MTTFYSPHYGPDVGETNHFTTLSAPVPAVPVGIKHARVRHQSAQIIVPALTDLADGDIIRLFDLRSSDRLIELFFSMDANWGATATFDIGLYLKGANNAGAVVDANLFSTADDWQNAQARVDVLTDGTLDDWDRGKQLWELVNAVTASTYAADPQVLFTVAVTATANITQVVGAVEFLCEATYVDGD